MLYQLCRDYPDHKSPEVITAKVWLIGRSYAAAIERGRTKEEDTDSFYESKVVPEIQASRLDKHIDKVKQFSEINSESASTILRTHKYLTDLFADISGKDKRSLASKYLHFHCPALYFLYDSRAARGARALYPRFRSELPIKKVDQEYAKFFLRLVQLRKDIYRKEGRLLSTREIDNILINVGSYSAPRRLAPCWVASGVSPVTRTLKGVRHHGRGNDS
jgi:hypothetical protein